METACDSLDRNCFLFNFLKALSMCSPGSKRDWGGLSRWQKTQNKLYINTHKCGKRGRFVLFFFGRWHVKIWPLTRHLLNTNEWQRKTNLNKYLALFSLSEIWSWSTDPVMWLPGLTDIQKPSLELESAIIIIGLFANSAVPNGSNLALYCSHSMDLA